MTTSHDLDRFIKAQQGIYKEALREIKNGRKLSHWMWFIFPQLAELGQSETAKFYGIHEPAEAQDYLDHPVLGLRLIEISSALNQLDGRSANQIFGRPDDLKLRSCMTLFSALPHTDPVFQAVLDKYYEGKKDEETMAILRELLHNV